MFVLPKIILLSLLALVLPQNPTTSKQELNDQLFEAVRKGDATAVAAVLDRGADVNAKFRYGATALFKAAERGDSDIVKVLLDRGADVKVRDSFYGASAMTWALDKKHLDVVRLLLEKDAAAVDDVLMNGIRGSNADLVKMALDRGGARADNLSAALVLSSLDPKSANINEMLKKAGALPPLEVDAATLQSYTGKYKGEPGPELTITTKDGILFSVGVGRGDTRLMPLDKTTFRPLTFGGTTLTFIVEDGKVTGATLKQGQTTTQLKRMEVSQ